MPGMPPKPKLNMDTVGCCVSVREVRKVLRKEEPTFREKSQFFELSASISGRVRNFVVATKLLSPSDATENVVE
jgi:hypothetical protein